MVEEAGGAGEELLNSEVGGTAEDEEVGDSVAKLKPMLTC